MRRFFFIITVSLLAPLLTACLPEDEKARPQAEESLRLGLALQPSSALFMVALEQGFFANEGLIVTVKTYPSGKRALKEGLFRGEIDAATSADLPVVMAALDQQPFRILATTFQADNINRIVARRDAGIEKPIDLAGKRIATQKSSAVHFFLHLFMLHNRLTERDVRLSFMKAEKLPTALAVKDIDAFSMREPYVSQARTSLGDDAIIFSAPGVYNQVEALVVGPEVYEKRPHLHQRILNALRHAERFCRQKPDRAITIVSQRLALPRENIQKLWPTFRFQVSLDHATLLLMESQARWAMTEGLTPVKALPDLLDFFLIEPLTQLDRTAVTVIW